MKRFQKFLKKAATGISVLLLIFIGFLIYRDVASYKNVIHQDATAIISIRVDAIGRAVVWDALKHPFYYYDLQKEKDTIEDEDKNGKGFRLPATIFLYTIKGKNASTIFASFKISNSEDFKAFLSADYKLEPAYSINAIKVAKNKDGNLIAAYTDDQCVLVYNPKKENVDAIFKDILIENKYLNASNHLFKTLKACKSHVNYVSDEDAISIDFSKGQAFIQGQLSTNGLFITKPTALPEFSNNSSLRFYLNATSTKKHDPIIFKTLTIEPDGLFAYYKGNLSLEIAGSTKQVNTVISYEYNDDFEKVETKVLAEKEIPQVTLQMSAASKGLMNYLETASIVENGRLNKELFPLWQVKVDTTEFGMNASTNLNTIMPSKSVSYQNVFGLEIDFEKLKAQNQFEFLDAYFEHLLNLNLKGSKLDAHTIKVEGKINFNNKEILSITQFL